MRPWWRSPAQGRSRAVRSSGGWAWFRQHSGPDRSASPSRIASTVPVLSLLEVVSNLWDFHLALPSEVLYKSGQAAHLVAFPAAVSGIVSCDNITPRIFLTCRNKGMSSGIPPRHIIELAGVCLVASKTHDSVILRYRSRQCRGLYIRFQGKIIVGLDQWVFPVISDRVWVCPLAIGDLGCVCLKSVFI